MNAPIHTKTFKSGNSIAVRLPKGLAIAAGETMIAQRSGDTLTLRLIPSSTQETERLAQFRAMLDDLKRIGPIGEIEVRLPFEFPDRPGL